MSDTKYITCPQCDTRYQQMFLMGKQGNLDTCPMCGGCLSDGEAKDHEQDGWITWWYLEDKKYGGLSLWDKMPLYPEYFEVVKEFKAPPEEVCGLDEVKRILRTYVPDAFVFPEKEEPVVRCPRCGSKEYTLLNKGYSIITGFLGSGRIKRVCNYCKKEF